MVRISGDASVAGQMRKTSDGRVEFSFPDRMVLIANHQVGSTTILKTSRTDYGRYTQTGFIFGGRPTQTPLRCTVTSI